MLTSIFTSIIACTGTNIDDIFVIMILLATARAADSPAEFPNVKTVIEKYRSIATPVVFIALSVFIILDTG